MGWRWEVATMSTSAADGPHEFVVEPELAELAERLGVPLHAVIVSGSRSSRSSRAAGPSRRLAVGV
jgi:hypothetical protein